MNYHSVALLSPKPTLPLILHTSEIYVWVEIAGGYDKHYLQRFISTGLGYMQIRGRYTYVYNPDNYHGISMSTIYAHIINKRLTHWTEITETHLEQAGFRTSYSTIDYIFTLYG